MKTPKNEVPRLRFPKVGVVTSTPWRRSLLLREFNVEKDWRCSSSGVAIPALLDTLSNTYHESDPSLTPIVSYASLMLKPFPWVATLALVAPTTRSLSFIARGHCVYDVAGYTMDVRVRRLFYIWTQFSRWFTVSQLWSNYRIPLQAKYTPSNLVAISILQNLLKKVGWVVATPAAWLYFVKYPCSIIMRMTHYWSQSFLTPV